MGIVLLILLVVIVFLVASAALATVIARHVIAPDARYFTLKIGRNGIRAFTEQGEIIPGTARYKNADLHKSKRRVAISDDGELIDFDDDDQYLVNYR